MEPTRNLATRYLTQRGEPGHAPELYSTMPETKNVAEYVAAFEKRAGLVPSTALWVEHAKKMLGEKREP